MFRKSRFALSFIVLMMLTASLTMLAGSIAAQGDANCPVGQGFWKNTAQWPVVELTIGGQTYNQAELLIILNTPSEGDASLILAKQIIAAKLNLANGQDGAVIQGVIDQADITLSAYAGKLPYNIAPSTAEGQTLTNLSTVTESYNAGAFTANCAVTPTPETTATITATPEVTPENTPAATPESTPEATPVVTAEPGDGLTITIVIEGPVEAININIITIYGINIELNPDDPLLLVIQIGDIIHIEGSTEDQDGTVIIIAVIVIVINVDVNPDTGEIWRDDLGNCDNPPPEWAPAHGWHRRCDDTIIIVVPGSSGGDDGGDGMGMGMGMGDD